MSWAITAPAIAAQLATVVPADGSPLGPIYVGDRHLRDQARFVSLFTTEDWGKRKLVRGWRVARVAIEERWFSNLRTMARERYVLRAVQAVTRTATDLVESGKSFQALLDSAWQVFRDVYTLGSTALVVEAQKTPGIEFLMFGDILCHYAEIEITATEYYTIGSVTQPVSTASTATTRAGYVATAEQLAAYLALASGAGNVFIERPDITDEAARDSFLVASDDDVDLRKPVRAWRVFRRADGESRGIAQRVEGRASWMLNNSRSWVDALDSYDAFQQHIDAARDVFRGVGCLGNTANVTQALSSPLQFPELGARMVADVLCHFADGALEVREVAHAAQVA